MPVSFEDQPNRVIVQEHNNRVEVSYGGPQGAPGPAGAAGAQGENGKYFVSPTEPTDAAVWDAWFNSTTAKMYLRYDGFWVETSTSFAGPRGQSGYLNGTNMDGGSASSIYTQIQLINGVSASSVYAQNQLINGGTAGSF